MRGLSHLLRRTGAAAAAFTVLATLSASPANASAGYKYLSAADAASPLGVWEPVPGGHFCQSTGPDRPGPLGQQGVACNNFYQTFWNVNNVKFRAVTSQIELKCGDSFGLLACTSALAIGNFNGGTVYTARCVQTCPAAGYKVFSSDVLIFQAGCRTVSATVNAQPGRGGFTLPDGTQLTMQGALISTVKVCA